MDQQRDPWPPAKARDPGTRATTETARANPGAWGLDAGETSPRKVRRLGIDPGFGGFKVGELGTQGIRVEVTPAVVGVARKRLPTLDLPGLHAPTTTAKPRRVSYEGIEYLVGPNIHRYARPLERLDFLRLSEGPELRSLMYAAMWPILGGGTQRAALVVGLPIQVLLDPEQAESIRETLKSWLLAEHVFAVDGESAEWTITQIEAVPQVMGTYHLCRSDELGLLDSNDENERVGVADIGFNTLDLMGVEKGAVVNRFTNGDTLGMRRAAETVAHAIHERLDVELSLYQADDLVVQTCNAERATLYHPEGVTDVTRLVRQALDNTASSVCSFIERAWGNGRQFRDIILTGGGATALQSYLLKLYPHAVVMPEPAIANVRGLAHWASHVF